MSLTLTLYSTIIDCRLADDECPTQNQKSHYCTLILMTKLMKQLEIKHNRNVLAQ